jgi:hypothetical protein
LAASGTSGGAIVRGLTGRILGRGGAGRAAAALFASRKVRTPQGRVLGNTQAGRPAESATESRPPPSGGKGETVR